MLYFCADACRMLSGSCTLTSCPVHTSAGIMNGAIEMAKADVSNYAVTGLWREFGINSRGW